MELRQRYDAWVEADNLLSDAKAAEAQQMRRLHHLILSDQDCAAYVMSINMRKLHRWMQDNKE